MKQVSGTKKTSIRKKANKNQLSDCVKSFWETNKDKSVIWTTKRHSKEDTLEKYFTS